jgi:hypothetical protein
VTALPVLNPARFSNGDLASSGDRPATGDFRFERPDWVMFRSSETLSQKDGVPKGCYADWSSKSL